MTSHFGTATPTPTEPAVPRLLLEIVTVKEGRAEAFFFFSQVFGRVRSSEIRPPKKWVRFAFLVAKKLLTCLNWERFSDSRRQFSCRFCGHHFWGLFFCSFSLRNKKQILVYSKFIHPRVAIIWTHRFAVFSYHQTVCWNSGIGTAC